MRYESSLACELFVGVLFVSLGSCYLRGIQSLSKSLDTLRNIRRVNAQHNTTMLDMLQVCRLCRLVDGSLICIDPALPFLCDPARFL